MKLHIKNTPAICISISMNVVNGKLLACSSTSGSIFIALLKKGLSTVDLKKMQISYVNQKKMI